MSATVSIDFLLLAAQATPEQQVAFKRFLRGYGGELGSAGGPTGAGAANANAMLDALARIERKVDELAAGTRVPERKEPLLEGECLRVFRLFGELLAMGTELVASPARVFDLMVFRKLTKAETAVACKCAASLITRRVAALETHFGMSMERLCNFASDIKERQTTVKGDRYARKKHGAVRDEVEQFDDGDAAGSKEDDDGYLPEERQSYD